MKKFVLATNLGVILTFISCLGSSASAQPMTHSANTSMIGSANVTTSSSTKMTLSQAAQALCLVRGPGPVCITDTVTIPRLHYVTRVNDTFRFQVGVFNDSPNPITVGTLCQAPITAIFDRHYVTVRHLFCNIFGPPRTIPPHSDTPVYGPPFTTVYEAIRTTAVPSHTVALLRFTYHTTTGTQHIYWPYALHIWP